MTFADSVAAIRERLTSNWSATPIAYVNEAFTVPVDGDNMPAPFVHLDVRHVLTTASWMSPAGSRFGVIDGQIWMYVFVPILSGMNTARDYADDLAAIFEGVNFDGIQVFEANDVGGDAADDNRGYFKAGLYLEYMTTKNL